MFLSSAFDRQQLKLVVKSCASGMGSTKVKIHSSQENCKATEIRFTAFSPSYAFPGCDFRALRLEPKSNAKGWKVLCTMEITKTVLGG